MKRRICWPNPDATCLEGGCGDCNNHEFKNVLTIREYALKAGRVVNRGGGSKPAIEAFVWGLNNGWANADVTE